MQVENKKNMIVISGRVDSSNADKFESDVFGYATEAPVVIDAEKLEYISSAGLRVLMKLKKKFSEVIVKNVKPEVYEILDMTGFTNILTVKKALKEIDITGLEIIGRGATGVVYRLDDDKILKLFFPGRLLYGIEYEKEAAKYAFMLGIPTAIAY
nr:STAS domain-containing protein [Lachnospiraceae bacterium]